MPSVSSYLRRLDIFGQPIQLHLKSKNKFQSGFGGVVSILCIGVIVLLFQNGMMEIINRTGYRISSKTEFKSGSTELRASEFMMAFRYVADINFELDISKPIFNYSLVHKRRTYEPITKVYNVTSTPLEYEQCRIEHFKNINGHSFEVDFMQLKLSEYWCLKIDQLMKLGGQYGGESEEYIKIEVAGCHDETKCHSYDELRDLMMNNMIPAFIMEFAFTNFVLDPHANILHPTIDNSFYYYFIPSFFYPKADIYTSQNAFIQDKSLIPFIQDVENRPFVSLRYEQSKFQQIYYNELTTFGEFYLRMTQDSLIVLKEYQRIDLFLAYFGGILKFIVFVLSLFVTHYNKFGFYVQLANHLYAFNVPLKGSKEFSHEKFLRNIEKHIEVAKNALDKLRKGALHLMQSKRMAQLFSPNQAAIKEGGVDDGNGNAQNKGNNYVADNDHQSPFVFKLHSPSMHLQDNNHNQTIDNHHINQHHHNQLHKRTTPIIPIVPIIENSPINHSASAVPLVAPQQEIEQPAAAPTPLLPQQDVYHSRKLFLDYAFTELVNTQVHLTMMFSYMLSRLCCRKFLFKHNQSLQLIDQAITLTRQDTDIATIIDRLQEIEKLKEILLTKKQRKIFNFTPKPIVTCKRQGHLLRFKTTLHNHKRENKDKEEKIITTTNTNAIFKKKSKYKSLKALHRLYKAYCHLNDHHATETKLEKRTNEKLMRLIGDDLNEVFIMSNKLPDDLTHEPHHHHHHHSNSKGNKHLKSPQKKNK